MHSLSRSRNGSVSQHLVLGAGLAVALALSACSKTESPAAPSPATPPAASPTSVAPPAHEGAEHAAATPASDAVKMTRTAAPAGIKIAFVGIKDGDTVSAPVKFGFGLEGAKIAPAGTMEPSTGHFHVIIDSDLPAQDMPLPATDAVKHFGKGQTDAELSLTPGTHTLQLEFTDGTHLPFDPAVTSDKITITVK